MQLKYPRLVLHLTRLDIRHVVIARRLVVVLADGTVQGVVLLAGDTGTIPGAHHVLLVGILVPVMTLTIIDDETTTVTVSGLMTDTTVTALNETVLIETSMFLILMIVILIVIIGQRLSGARRGRAVLVVAPRRLPGRGARRLAMHTIAIPLLLLWSQ